MYDLIFKEARIINRGAIHQGDVAVKDGRIVKISGSISNEARSEVKVNGGYLMPGVIDDQVHFREPGLEHKANIRSESRAAVAGGTTSFMEMPNTKPPVVTIDRLEEKYKIGEAVSPANYSFFLGATNDNIEEVKRVDPQQVCGVKIFMGSSTGNMLVDQEKALDLIFKHSPMLIATHCEDEETIAQNAYYYKALYGDNLNARHHPMIRSREGCYLSSCKAIDLAKKHNSRLHILHISTADEIALFDNTIPLEAKRITSEVCVHHLSFNSDDYESLGNRIKCNPAIKEKFDQEALWKGLFDGNLDIIATDHAPHTIEEKSQSYSKAPSGLPLVQHALMMMLQHFHAGRISLEQIVDKMCHAPAQCFQLAERGYIDEGMYGDIVLLDPNAQEMVNKDNILYKCNWSPLEGRNLKGKVKSTYVNGQLVYDGENVLDITPGMRLNFKR